MGLTKVGQGVDLPKGWILPKGRSLPTPEPAHYDACGV